MKVDGYVCVRNGKPVITPRCDEPLMVVEYNSNDEIAFYTLKGRYMITIRIDENIELGFSPPGWKIYAKHNLYVTRGYLLSGANVKFFKEPKYKIYPLFERNDLTQLQYERQRLRQRYRIYFDGLINGYRGLVYTSRSHCLIVYHLNEQTNLPENTLVFETTTLPATLPTGVVGITENVALLKKPPLPELYPVAEVIDRTTKFY